MIYLPWHQGNQQNYLVSVPCELVAVSLCDVGQTWTGCSETTNRMEHMSVRRKENFYCACRVRGRMAVGKATEELGEHSPSC